MSSWTGWAKVVEPEPDPCPWTVRPPVPGAGTPPVSTGVRVPLCNLAPADLKKDANGFDLPIALGLLLASGQVAFDRPGNYAIVGVSAPTDMP